MTTADKQPPTLDDYHAHEVMDRLNLIMSNVDDFLLSHPYVQANTFLHASVESVTGILGQLYQMVGAMHLNAPEPEAEPEWVEVAHIKWDGDKMVAKLK